MDPQACLERWRNATLCGDASETRDALADLVDWLNRGGFWPTGIYRSELDALRREGLIHPDVKNNTVPCPHCKHRGPHEDNGEQGLHKAFRCDCGTCFDAYNEGWAAPE